MTRTDLANGLPAAREAIRTTEPDEPFWSENLLFALYDPTSDVGLWLHLGTVPNDWGMWHEMCYAYLPGDDGVLSMWSHHRTTPERRPGGANSRFVCVEPFRRWQLSFDGFGLHTPNAAMVEGLAHVGPLRRFVVELDVEFVAPVWDLHAATSEPGKGSMREQGWAKDHYEQLYRARGRVVLGEDEIDFDGYGWRDHSQGPRGGGTGAPWGGHVITGTVYPDSGRAWGLCRYWTPDGTISLEGGYVVTEDGRFHHAEVTDAPRLRTLTMEPEELPIGLRWEGGTLQTTITTRRSLWLSMMKGLVVGRDLDGPGLMYVLNHGPSMWDGEVGHNYVERSDPLNAFPEDLHQ